MHYQQGQDRDQVYMTSLDQQVPDDSFARIVDKLVETMPLESLGFQYTKSNRGGSHSYHPKDMLKLLLFAYRNGMRSAQKIANYAKFNIEAIWLMKGLHPCSRTINYFRSNNAKAIKKARRYFQQLQKNSSTNIEKP